MEIPSFNFTATGVGSVPSRDVDATCRFILQQLPLIPFWPQFVNLDPLEDMILQYSEGLPAVDAQNGGGACLRIPEEGLETELAGFYERYLEEDTDAFSIGPDRARGLYTLLDLMDGAPPPKAGFVKGQIVGPITYASSVTEKSGRPILHDPALLDVVVKGLSLKLLWQARRLEQTGRRPILFIDEPVLSGIGSAFSSMNQEEVSNALKEIIDYVRERSDALLGIHCCGNTDWPMVMESGPDILNFDAYGYMDSFLLYPEEVVTFVRRGGAIAWGIVPTLEYEHGLTAEALEQRLSRGLLQLKEWGLEEDEIRARSLLTPACGMGSMRAEFADEVLLLLSGLRTRMQ